ncbi:hypothetical protein [Desulfoluna spongiiphila]|uniref:Uncharacterized protein n=1 Tax=Desulfoluna spongiiphila TaxID=419481 RepID=A0A1G5DHK2_9BACT|nr:hypothetical protein [Desulfoluna spongiiphila]SCY14021.1 hypothetical protein SAMN05216233_104187 [Desulfoluna spongiiphila]
MEDENVENMNDNVKTETAKKVKNNQNGFSSFLWDLSSLIFLICILLWNIDGVWQTDIKFIKNIQKNYFSQKYKSEQLKISRITHNNEIIEDIQRRLDRTMQKYESQLVQVNSEKEQAEKVALLSQQKLESYLETENNKCRYYQTALMIIKNLRRHYSEDELQKIITCTNPECVDILSFKTEAFDVCTK